MGSKSSLSIALGGIVIFCKIAYVDFSPLRHPALFTQTTSCRQQRFSTCVSSSILLVGIFKGTPANKLDIEWDLALKMVRKVWATVVNQIAHLDHDLVDF